jgi:hypothetical protein
VDAGPTWKAVGKRQPHRKLTLSVPAALRERMERAERELAGTGTRPNWSAVCAKALDAFLRDLGK